MDAVILLDMSFDMQCRGNTVKTALKTALRRLSSGTRVAVVVYPQVCMMCDFTDDPNTLAAAVEGACSRCCEGVECDTYLAFAYMVTPWCLSWRDVAVARGAVVHITNSPPRDIGSSEWSRPKLGDTGVTADWIEIGRLLDRARVPVHCFLMKDDRFSESAPWHAAMAALTGSDGVTISGDNVQEMARQVSDVLDGRVSSASKIRFSSDAEQRLFETPNEDNATNLLSDPSYLRVDGPDMYARIALYPAFAGLVRNDADTTRVKITPWLYEESLKREYADLRRSVAAALGRNAESEDDDGAYDMISAMTYRELCEDFVAGSPAETIRDMFTKVSSLIVGPGMCAPYTLYSGKFNYQSAFSINVRAIRNGYTVSYSQFLNYITAKRLNGWWNVQSRYQLRSGVEDIVMRDKADVTGVLPLMADDTRLASEVFVALAGTQWLDAIAWHSTCRHVFPPPHACAGVLASALWSGARDRSVNISLLRRIVRSVRALKRIRSRGGSAVSDVAKQLAIAAQSGVPDWDQLVRHASTNCVRSFIRGSSAFESAVHRAGSRFAAATSEVDVGLRRVAEAMDTVPPHDLLSKAEHEVHRATYGSSTHEAIESVPEAIVETRGALPKLGSKRFNKCLSDVAVSFRKAAGLRTTGRDGETFTVDSSDVRSDKVCCSGTKLLMEHGSVEFRFVEGRWIPMRVGTINRATEIRSGRTVYVWPTISDSPISSSESGHDTF